MVSAQFCISEMHLAGTSAVLLPVPGQYVALLAILSGQWLETHHNVHRAFLWEEMVGMDVLVKL